MYLVLQLQYYYCSTTNNTTTALLLLPLPFTTTTTTYHGSDELSPWMPAGGMRYTVVVAVPEKD